MGNFEETKNQNFNVNNIKQALNGQVKVSTWRYEEFVYKRKKN